MHQIESTSWITTSNVLSEQWSRVRTSLSASVFSSFDANLDQLLNHPFYAHNICQVGFDFTCSRGLGPAATQLLDLWMCPTANTLHSRVSARYLINISYAWRKHILERYGGASVNQVGVTSTKMNWNVCLDCTAHEDIKVFTSRRRLLESINSTSSQGKPIASKQPTL